MTFQVGLVGHDGLVIASDRRAVAEGNLNTDSRWVRQTSEVRKILLRPETFDFVCVYSINEVAADIAARLVEDRSIAGFKSNDDVIRRLRTKCEEIIQGYAPEYRPFGSTLMVALPRAPIEVARLWRISFFPNPIVTERSPRAYGGDAGNSAIYFAERFQDNGEECKRSIEELTTVAAHTVLEGYQLNKTFVGGLDVCVCKDGNDPYFVEGEELRGLKERSAELSKRIEGLLLRQD